MSNKMTDNKIIKALECCRDCNCKECPCYNKETNGCKEIDEQDIIDLIKRYKAEIEKLQLVISCCNTEKAVLEGELKYTEIKAISDFGKRLCADRVSNDPVVIAVMAEFDKESDKFWERYRVKDKVGD